MKTLVKPFSCRVSACAFPLPLDRLNSGSRLRPLPGDPILFDDFSRVSRRHLPNRLHVARRSLRRHALPVQVPADELVFLPLVSVSEFLDFFFAFFLVATVASFLTDSLLHKNCHGGADKYCRYSCRNPGIYTLKAENKPCLPCPYPANILFRIP